ncbi:hypothetical protein NITLEN_10079 [Nitrospira lenta]|uniref:Uncharacterized protein n=1 Tax=Nitrospira lenta TaxID=1436998 RepID=A0A330L1A2_9BACT|nr:hypothetical protein NITLEN_10079 [Nitrospira lenta]
MVKNDAEELSWDLPSEAVLNAYRHPIWMPQGVFLSHLLLKPGVFNSASRPGFSNDTGSMLVLAYPVPYRP